MMLSREEMEAALHRRIGKERAEKFENSIVAICGLGGLGSNIAVALARAGVGRLILIDFDRVEPSNLNRQQYLASQVGEKKTEALTENLRAINPYLEITAIDARLNEKNYKKYLSEADIVCEAFDDPEEKSKLTDFVTTRMPGTYFIAASGMAGLGSPNDIKTRKITDRFFLCGNGTVGTEDGEPLFSAGAMLCAAHQAMTALRIMDRKNTEKEG